MFTKIFENKHSTPYNATNDARDATLRLLLPIIQICWTQWRNFYDNRTPKKRNSPSNVWKVLVLIIFIFWHKGNFFATDLQGIFGIGLIVLKKSNESKYDVKYKFIDRRPDQLESGVTFTLCVVILLLRWDFLHSTVLGPLYATAPIAVSPMAPCACQ